jgi:hypothetical protein
MRNLPKKQLDKASAATLLALAADLGESPLAQALERLAGTSPATASSDVAERKAVGNPAPADATTQAIRTRRSKT